MNLRMSGQIALCLGFLLLFSQPSAANTISIKASAVASTQLPEPGQMLQIPIMLEGTKRFDHVIRAQVVRDGVFIDMTLDRGTLDDNDRPIFKLTLPAPLRELKLRFFLYGENNEVIASTDEFITRRGCIPQLSDRDLVEKVGEDPDKANDGTNDGLLDAQRLALQSRILERHIYAYESSIKLLEEIETVLKAQAGAGGGS